MKYIPHIFLCASLSFLTSQALAQDNFCPSVEIISKLSFTSASRPQSFYRWGLETKFEYNGKTWQIVFVPDLPNAKTPEQALQQGQELYSKTTFKNPVNLMNEVCDYTNNQDDYLLLSFVKGTLASSIISK